MIIQELLQQEYFGNTIYNYLFAFAIVIAIVILGKAFDFILKRYFKELAKRTKSKVDDIFVIAIEKPFMLFFFVIGMYVASFFLNFPETVSSVFTRVLSSLMIFAVSWFFINLIDLSIDTYLEPFTRKSESELDDHLVPLLRKLVRTVLILIAAIMVLSDLGFDVASILAGLGIGGLAFALAAKDLLANLFGGIAIILDKSFGLGQRIKVQGVDGKVKQIGLRTTIIESFDGTKLTVPNSKIADSIIENVSYEEARKIKTILGISYDTSNAKLEKAINELKKMIDGHENVKEKTTVRFDNYGASTIDVLVVYWISNLSMVGETKHEINMAIKKKMEDLKIDMPYPTQTINIKK